MSVAPSTLNDLADDTDGGADNDTEMDELLKTVKSKTQFLFHNKSINRFNTGCLVCRTHPRSFEVTGGIEQYQAPRV